MDNQDKLDKVQQLQDLKLLCQDLFNAIEAQQELARLGEDTDVLVCFNLANDLLMGIEIMFSGQPNAMEDLCGWDEQGCGDCCCKDKQCEKEGCC